MIPSKKELALLVSLTVCCTLIVGLLPQRDIGLMCCGGSLTLVAALLGYRRNQIRLAILAEEQRVKSEE
jgi:enoyl-CoA hydratase/carnithine racemase